MSVSALACVTPAEEGNEPRVNFLGGDPVGGLHPGNGASGAGGVGVSGFGGSGGVGVSGFGGSGGVGVSGFGGSGGVGVSGFGGSGGVGVSGFGGAGGSGGVGVSGSGGVGGTGGASGTGGSGGTRTVTQLVVDYTTVSQGGRYSPNNVGAAWVERASGGWVKTMEAWFFIRGGNLRTFNAASGGNRVDAISSATLPRFGAHHNTWNLKDVNGGAMPDGDYRVVIECTDRDGSSKTINVPFALGPSPATFTSPGDSNFNNITLSLQ